MLPSLTESGLLLAPRPQAISRRDGEQLLPGLIFNLNKKVSYTDPLTGTTRQVRIESSRLLSFVTRCHTLHGRVRRRMLKTLKRMCLVSVKL